MKKTKKQKQQQLQNFLFPEKMEVNTVVQPKQLGVLDTAKLGVPQALPTTRSTPTKSGVKLVAKKLNPARIDDVRNEFHSRVHKISPVSIVRERRRELIAKKLERLTETDPTKILKATICANRKIRKAVMTAKRYAGKGTPKTKTIWSNIKC